MQTLVRRPALDPFWSELATAEHRVLMTDYDGVVAPFHPDPRQARPYPDVPPLLDRINRRERSRVVVVTGRDVREVVELLGMSTQPEVWGSHGHQHLASSGEVTSPDLPPVVRDALAVVAETAQRSPGAGRIEVKPYGVALHWRGAAAEALEEVRRNADGVMRAAESDFPGLFVRHDFDGGIELLVRGRDKGSALTDVLAPLGGFRAAYLGDDVTDEDAFRAAPPSVLTVLVRPELRPTAASAWITPPEELIDFLERWDDACSAQVSTPY